MKLGGFDGIWKVSEEVKFKKGDWVVRIFRGSNSRDSAQIGDIRHIDESGSIIPNVTHINENGEQDYIRQSEYRPATPEEIAAHLGGIPANTNTILDRAKSIITGNRQTTHGKPERSFHKIAERWSLTLGTLVTAQQVAFMMVDLKMVRALDGVTTEGHDDHFVDMAGYVALAAELGENNG